MISDVLFEASQQICDYQANMSHVYDGMKEELDELVAEMRRIQLILDTCPTVDTQTSDKQSPPQATDFSIPKTDAQKQLQDKLLALGGTKVIHLPDSYLQEHLKHGKSYEGYDAVLNEMEKSQCHSNSAKLWLLKPSTRRIATGYALSSDGIWRQHTWVIETNAHWILETTVPRTRYFGVEIGQGNPSFVFAAANLGIHALQAFLNIAQSEGRLDEIVNIEELAATLPA